MRARERGPAGVAAFMRDFLARWEDFRMEAERMERIGDTVLVHVRQVGRGRTSGAESDQRYLMLWTFRDGLAARVDMFVREEDARAAADA